jgi:hypothetical protein
MLMHWHLEPPISVLFAQFAGLKPRTAIDSSPARSNQSVMGGKDEPGKWSELRALFPQGVIRG